MLSADHQLIVDELIRVLGEANSNFVKDKDLLIRQLSMQDEQAESTVMNFLRNIKDHKAKKLGPLLKRQFISNLLREEIGVIRFAGSAYLAGSQLPSNYNRIAYGEMIVGPPGDTVSVLFRFLFDEHGTIEKLDYVFCDLTDSGANYAVIHLEAFQ